MRVPAFRRLHVLALCAGLCGLLPASPAGADGRFSLGGHSLGARLDSVLADPRFDCSGAAGCFLFESCRSLETQQGGYRGAPLAGLTLYFTGERLSGIEAHFPEPEFQRLVRELTDEYGAPETAQAQTPDNPVYLWRSGSRLVRLERLLRPNRSSVIVAERHLLRELVRR